MKFSMECTYCGHKWVETAYNPETLRGKICPHGNCKDKRIIVRDLNSSKIDYYEGSPAFPIQLEKNEGWFGLKV